MNTIEQRLQVLERQLRAVRRVNWVLLFALVAMVCIAGVQATTPSDAKPESSGTGKPPDLSRPDDRVPPDGDRLRIIEAHQFVLIDRLGRSRATMAVTEDGPALSMFDERGRKRIELRHTTKSSGLRLLDTNESAVASLQVQRDIAQAQLEITSPQGRSLMKASGFAVLDSAEQSRLLLALINGNFPVFGISRSGRRSGPPSVEITPSGLTMHNEDGYPLFSVSVGKNSEAHLNMRHPHHDRSLQISAGARDNDGPRLEFFAPSNGGLLPFLQLGLRQDREPYIQIVDRDGWPLFTAPRR